MYILGLTTLGDSAATLIRDGEIVAAAEEERFSRTKHHSGFPYRAVQFCLDQAGITMADVEHVVRQALDGHAIADIDRQSQLAPVQSRAG